MVPVFWPDDLTGQQRVVAGLVIGLTSGFRFSAFSFTGILNIAATTLNQNRRVSVSVLGFVSAGRFFALWSSYVQLHLIGRLNNVC